MYYCSFINIFKYIFKRIDTEYILFNLINNIIFSKILNISYIYLFLINQIIIFIYLLFNKKIYFNISYNYFFIYPIIYFYIKNKFNNLFILFFIYNFLFIIFIFFLEKKINLLKNIFLINFFLGFLLLIISINFSNIIWIFFNKIYLYYKWKYIILSLSTFLLCNFISFYNNNISYKYIFISILINKLIFNLLNLKEPNNYLFKNENIINIKLNDFLFIIPFFLISFIDYYNNIILLNKKNNNINKYFIFYNIFNIIFLYFNFLIPSILIYKENYFYKNINNFIINFFITLFLLKIKNIFLFNIPFCVLIGIILFLYSIIFIYSIKIINKLLNFSNIKNLIFFSSFLFISINNNLYIHKINISNVFIFIIIFYYIYLNIIKKKYK